MSHPLRLTGTLHHQQEGYCRLGAGREDSQQVLHPVQTTQEAVLESVRAGVSMSRAQCELWHS